MRSQVYQKNGIPPDGGWGWLIVLGSSIMNLCTRALEPSFGLLFGGLLRQLGVGTTGAAVVMSTLDFCINFSGFFVGPLVKKFSYRKVAMMGGLFATVAFLTASFATSMTHLLLTYGMLGGFGFGFVQASTYVGLNNYFLKRRAQAVGLALAGTAIGFMTMPQIVSFLLRNYDFRGALMIIGALSLNSFVGASLFQPVEWHMKYPDKPQNIAIRKPTPTDLNNEEPSVTLSLLDITKGKSRASITPAFTQRQMSVPAQSQSTGRSKITMHRMSDTNLKRKASSNVSIIDFSASTTHIDSSGKKREARKKKMPPKKEKGCWSRFSELMDFNLLKDAVYLNILFGISISYVAELNFKMIVPFFMDSLGYTLQETAHVLSVTAVADLSARLIVPPILDRISYSKRTTLMIGGCFVVVTRSALAEQTKTVPLLVCFILHGFFRGATLINFPLVLSEYATQENFPAALGLSMVSKAIFIVIFGPLVGYIRDTSGSYPLSIHVQSLFLLSCIVAWGIEYLIVYFRSKKHSEDKPEEPPDEENC